MWAHDMGNCNRRQKFGAVLPWKIVLEQACVHRAASFPSRRRRTDCSSSRAESQDNSDISTIRRLPMCVLTLKLHMSHMDLEFCIGLLFAESGPLEARNPSDQRTPQERNATSLAQSWPFFYCCVHPLLRSVAPPIPAKPKEVPSKKHQKAN